MVKPLEEICIEALLEAHHKHQELGGSGTEMVRQNQFGDTAMRGDVEAEEAVLRILRSHGLPALIRSEEHGETYLTKNPSVFGVLDGIDGSHWYKSAHNQGRYGTLLGIYSDTDPVYDDYLFSGIMEHATKRLFYAVKGKGSFILHIDTGKTVEIATSGETDFNRAVPIHVDEFWEINKDTFLKKLGGYSVLPYHLCSSVHYADVAAGESGLALECTRKGNLEIAALFGLIKEAGGTMITLDGSALNGKKYHDFGQNEHIPVITAASETLAQKAANFFRS